MGSESKIHHKSPIMHKSSVASKHPGVFMETSELEAESEKSLDDDLNVVEIDTNEDHDETKFPSNEEDSNLSSEISSETPSVRKKHHARSKKKRFSTKRSTTQNNLNSKQDIIQAEDSSSSSANQEDIDHKANISQNPSLDIDSESTNDSKNKDIKSSISVREKISYMPMVEEKSKSPL